MSAWRDQYDRAHRYLARVTEIASGVTHVCSALNYTDDMLAFFQNCYHLKDWIKNDASLDPFTRCAVECHVSANRELRLCADIANGAKHLAVTRSRSKENPKLGATDYHVVVADGPGVGPTTLSANTKVDTTTDPTTVIQLANKCMEQWDAYLRERGLL